MVINSLVISCLIFWGAWGIFDKKGLSVVKPEGQLVAVYCFSPLFALATLCVLALRTDPWHLNSGTLFYTALGTIANLAATLGYLWAMSRQEASLILGATASYPVMAQLLAKIMLGEELVLGRVVGCSIVVAGIVALSWTSRVAVLAGPQVTTGYQATASAPNKKLLVLTGTALAIAGWALRGIFDKLAVRTGASLEVYFGKCLFDSIACGLLLGWFFYKRGQKNLLNARVWPAAFGSACCLAGGNAVYYIALSLSSAAYVIAITGCYPLLMYLLALIVLKERFGMARFLGIVLITVGAIFTQMTRDL